MQKTKRDILMSAAQSVLMQANAKPSQILSLLK